MSVYMSARDFVITEMIPVTHVQLLTLTVTEYTGARIVSNQHVVSVAQHKTVHCYGSVKICQCYKLYMA